MKGREDLLEGLRRTPRILSEFVKTIPEDKIDLRRGADFWTIAEQESPGSSAAHAFGALFFEEVLSIPPESSSLRL